MQKAAVGMLTINICMIKRYFTASLVMLVFLSFTRLFSYTEPHAALYDGPGNNEDAGANRVAEVSEDAFLAAKYAHSHFPGMLSFAGERIPLENEHVYERMDRALKKHYRSLDRNQQLLAGNPRTMEVIDRILRKYGIPSDFRYLPIIESRLTRAVSSKGAGGYWQLMPATARTLGLTVNDQVDERNDLVKSTVAACRYLRSLYRDLGSWTLAAAAYNTGQGALRKHIRNQGTGSYYLLDLSTETERYLYRLVAVKELLDNPGKYRALYEG